MSASCVLRRCLRLQIRIFRYVVALHPLLIVTRALTLQLDPLVEYPPLRLILHFGAGVCDTLRGVERGLSSSECIPLLPITCVAVAGVPIGSGASLARFRDPVALLRTCSACPALGNGSASSSPRRSASFFLSFLILSASSSKRVSRSCLCGTGCRRVYVPPKVVPSALWRHLPSTYLLPSEP